MKILDTLYLTFIIGTPSLFLSYVIASVFMGEHLIDKTFRRGKGIPAKEFKDLGCLRGSDTIFLATSLLKDPRLNDAQRLIFIEEVYQENPICPQGDQLEHDRRKNEVITKAAITNKVLNPIYSKRLTPEMLVLIIKELPPYKTSTLFLASITEDKYTSGSSGIENIKLFLTNPKVTKEAFKEAFNKLLLSIDDAIQLSKGLELSKGFVDLISIILNTPKFSPEEVSLLCYSNMGWLRQIVVKNPKCSTEAKIVAILMNSSIKG